MFNVPTGGPWLLVDWSFSHVSSHRYGKQEHQKKGFYSNAGSFIGVRNVPRFISKSRKKKKMECRRSTRRTSLLQLMRLSFMVLLSELKLLDPACCLLRTIR